MSDAPRFHVRELALHERPVTLRLPFRFGVVTLTECPQAFAHARIELPDGRSSWGGAAELMAPKWFDKNLSLSNDDNFAQLRDVLELARAAYLADPSADSAFGHFARISRMRARGRPKDNTPSDTSIQSARRNGSIKSASGPRNLRTM